MKVHEIIRRIAALPPYEPGVARVPPIELVAMVTRSGRALRQWKKVTLADFARVSLSTVERVERAEAVGAEALDRIAQALGHEKGAFTVPRVPLMREEAAAQVTTEFGKLEAVDVRPFSMQRQVRMVGACQAFLVDDSSLGEGYAEQVHELKEWLDLASFVLGPNAIEGSVTGRRRDLCKDVLAAVKNLERRGVTVLVGTMAAPLPGLPDWTVAILTLTPRLTDPGAPKRRTVVVDRRCLKPGPDYLSHLLPEAA